MAWYWPKIEDESSAESATKSAVGVSCFVGAVSSVVAIISIASRRPIFGFDGWSLVDGILFFVIAWRIHRMSRIWAVLGLVIYLGEIVSNLASGAHGSVGVLTIVFVLTYISAIRGAFTFHKYRNPVAVA